MLQAITTISAPQSASSLVRSEVIFRSSSVDFSPYGQFLVSAMYLYSSFGRIFLIASRMVVPPMPESNKPIFILL